MYACAYSFYKLRFLLLAESSPTHYVCYIYMQTIHVPYVIDEMFQATQSHCDVNLCAPNILYELHKHMPHNVVPCRHHLLHQPTCIDETPLVHFYSCTSTQL